MSPDPREAHWARIHPQVWSRYGTTIKAMSDKGKVELRREADGGRSWRLARYVRPGEPA